MTPVRQTRPPVAPTSIALVDDPLWFKDAVIYELHVRGFADSNGDGIGDFPGLIERLPYLQDLGVTALWLLPFYPSPLRDDGYDTADYLDVHPSYGTLRDFKRFLREAHRRRLRVITELVINHTSSDHPWFQRARRAPPGSPERDFYVWTDDPQRYSGARIIFPDFESSNWTWDPVAGQYYWHRFYSHQPDLNFDNPAVHRAVLSCLDFWLDLGVDGMRLDAIPYLYEREGTNCENLAETHAFLKELRAHVDARYANRMFLAEANQWPEDAAQYFGDGDECHMNFHFPLMPRMFMAVDLENNLPILDILEQTPTIPESCQWALFLRNHDELTLEMVTDEDRDFMYRVYASDPKARINLGIRRRLAPLLRLRRKIELMNGLLFSLPGTPVLYYGDEIGMGDNFHLGDRDGVRTPMQWSYDRNAGFSRSNPQRLYLPLVIDPEFHYQAVNVEAQQANRSSLLWWMKRLIALRKQHPVFGRGTCTFLRPDNHRVIAYVRELGDQRVLVVANLSRFAQAVELDLRDWRDLVPVEMFGHAPFPRIGDAPYLLSLGPHGFYWFSLTVPADARVEGPYVPPELELDGPWTALLDTHTPLGGQLGRALPGYLRRKRWFRGKARLTTTAAIADAIPLDGAGGPVLALIRVEYRDAPEETYAVPLAYAAGADAHDVERDHPEAVLARLHLRSPATGATEHGVVYDALITREHASAFLEAFTRRRHYAGRAGRLVAEPFRDGGRVPREPLRPRVLGVEQSNTSVVFGEQLILKLARRVERGTDPESEIGKYLTRRRFSHTPALLGTLEYQAHDGGALALGVLQRFEPNLGDAWEFTLQSLASYFERALTLSADAAARGPGSLLERSVTAPPEIIEESTAGFLAMARLLGERTGELHRELAADTEDPDFAPEPFSTLYQRSLYQAARTAMISSLDLLRARRSHLPESVQPAVDRVVELRDTIDTRLRRVCGRRLDTLRIRCHGDLHLGQVLYTGSDFAIIDFEGEPGRPIGERRIKRSPLRDVAGMLRSFHYAAETALRARTRPEDLPVLAQWAAAWRSWVSAQYVRAYMDTVAGTALVPPAPADRERLLDFMLIDKCAYELAYELNNRPEWVWIPALALEELAHDTRRP